MAHVNTVLKYPYYYYKTNTISTSKLIGNEKSAGIGAHRIAPDFGRLTVCQSLNRVGCFASSASSSLRRMMSSSVCHLQHFTIRVAFRRLLRRSRSNVLRVNWKMRRTNCCGCILHICAFIAASCLLL